MLTSLDTSKSDSLDPCGGGGRTAIPKMPVVNDVEEERETMRHYVSMLFTPIEKMSG